MLAAIDLDPLAAMTFALHLLHTHADLPKSAQGLVQDTTEMLGRISAVPSITQEMHSQRKTAGPRGRRLAPCWVR